MIPIFSMSPSIRLVPTWCIDMSDRYLGSLYMMSVWFDRRSSVSKLYLLKEINLLNKLMYFEILIFTVIHEKYLNFPKTIFYLTAIK